MHISFFKRISTNWILQIRGTDFSSFFFFLSPRQELWSTYLFQLVLYTHNTYIMTNFNERTITLLYKNIPLTLYSQKGWCWLCVRGELETRTDCYILTQSSSDHSSTSFSTWLGCSTVGHWGPKALCLPQGYHSSILSPTDSNCNWNSNWLKPSGPGYIIV